MISRVGEADAIRQS
ncbi:hypothetical protein QLX08_002139 [Tetragonisca angustula]|uniref:Uncharacterized protein n=1 Tax=Tetragonisca angustula TaxID=166442 RepID=A0AAW1ABU6_9HYME